jgi:nucleotide-binding universal stress UspA family protein
MPASSLRTKTPVMHITATFDALEVKRSSVMMSEQRRRMKMKVLLATDGSKFSQAATDAVISQCQPRGTEVKVLNVVDLPLMIPTLYAAEFREEGLRQGEEVVRGAEQQLTKAGYRVEAEVDEGDPKSKIVEDAARWNADLIVLGSHGRKGVDRFFDGKRVGCCLAPCPLFGADRTRFDKRQGEGDGQACAAKRKWGSGGWPRCG